MGKTRRKKEKSIRYRSSLHKSALKQCVAARVREFSRQTEFLYRETGDDSLWLGIEKGDHAGWWYIASLQDSVDGCFIEGKIVYDPDNYTVDSRMNLFSKIVLGFLIPILIFWLIRIFRKEKTKEENLDIFMRDYLECKKIEQ